MVSKGERFVEAARRSRLSSLRSRPVSWRPVMKLMSAASLCLAAATVMAQEPVWNASAIKDCDRACLVGVLDGYMNAVFKKDPKAVPPLSIDVRMAGKAAQ